MTRTKIIVAAIGIAALSRVMPHPPNFTPVTAIALFGGACLACRLQAIIIPLAAMFLSDCVLEIFSRIPALLASVLPSPAVTTSELLTNRFPGAYEGWFANASGFHSGWWVVYGSFVAVTLIGMLVGRRRSVLTVAAGTLAGSTLFFLVTNFAVWAAGEMYPRTLAGLLTCYELAVPFWIDPYKWWQAPLLGDIFYTSILFGGYALAERWVPKAEPAVPPGLAGEGA